MLGRRQKLGPYTLVEQIGEGGVAQVYRAVRSGAMGFRKQVALKKVRARVAANDKVIQGLINEARVGGFLQHRNVAEVYEFDQEGRTFYLAMELVQGYTVGQILARTRPPTGLPPRLVGEIAAQMCDGLAYAHDERDDAGQPLRLVHRDLKPSNVMVNLKGVVKITDFGIAKATTNLYLTTVGSTKGTPAYMSPEQVQGLPLDGRSDLFSAATVVAEALTGKRAFDAKGLTRVMKLVLAAEVTEILERVTERAAPLAPILWRAWQPKPDERYADAAEMGADVRSVLDALEGEDDLGSWIRSLDLSKPAEIDPSADPLTLPDGAVVILDD